MSAEPATLPVVRDEGSEPAPADGDWDRAADAPGLPPRTLRAARLVCEALFSTAEGPPPAERLDWVEAELADFFAHVTLRAQLLFRACLATVYLLSPVLVGRLRTMGGLTVDDRVAALHALERTPLSLALLGCKAILCIVYYEHPDAAASIGWDQRCMR